MISGKKCRHLNRDGVGIGKAGFEVLGFSTLPLTYFCDTTVERTFGWLNWCRRLSKDYESLPTSETFIYIAMIRIMVRRLA